MATESIDVLVIGAGAAGAALTWRLSEQGVKVICLEQGDWVDPSTFPSLKPGYESELFRGDFNLFVMTRTAGTLVPCCCVFHLEEIDHISV